MQYEEAFKTEAAATIAPLFNRVQELLKQLATVRQRATDEEENTGRIAQNLEDLKGDAGPRLAADRDGYARFLTSLKKLDTNLETSQKAAALFTKEIVPNLQREIDAARFKLERALVTLYTVRKIVCESTMTALLGAVVQEHDSFLAAARQTFTEYGVGLPPNLPRAAHARIDGIEKFLTRPPQLVFTAPPLVPAPLATATVAPGSNNPPPAVSQTPLDGTETATPLDGEPPSADSQAAPEEAAPEAPAPAPPAESDEEEEAPEPAEEKI